ncbi:MAG TPA: hypothetical protein VHD34_02575 [Xanthobacteraceae bacterium]|nr:hypothetical protein [Xanthobacteraceae bacterium]
MIAILGVLVVGLSAWSIWYLLPRDGKVHWLVTTPFLEWLLPLGIISGLSMGILMVVSVFAP